MKKNWFFIVAIFMLISSIGFCVYGAYSDYPEGIGLPSPAPTSTYPEGIGLPVPTSTPTSTYPEGIGLPASSSDYPEGIGLPAPTPTPYSDYPEGIGLPVATPNTSSDYPEGIGLPLPTPNTSSDYPEGIGQPESTPYISSDYSGYPEGIGLPVAPDVNNSLTDGSDYPEGLGYPSYSDYYKQQPEIYIPEDMDFSDNSEMFDTFEDNGETEEDFESEKDKEEVQELKKEINTNIYKILEIENRLKKLREEKCEANELRDLLIEKIGLLNEQISNTDVIIRKYNNQIKNESKMIEELQVKEDEQYDLFCRQVRDMEEQGSVTYLSILFSASTFTELLDNVMLISEIMEYHNNVIDTLKATQAEKADMISKLEVSIDKQKKLQEQQSINKAELKAEEEQVAQLIENIEIQEDAYTDEVALLENNLVDLGSIAKIINISGEEWYWPIDDRYYISSTFAPRIHPITGKYGHHTGNDIPAPAGTEIHAANSGVVLEVGKNTAYGNYVKIGHSDGFATFYAHMITRAIVSEGDPIMKGEVIGYVGSTGWSTGNHLHFEVFLNGVRGDSLLLYPELASEFRF